MSEALTQTLELTPVDNDRLANLCGQFDDHIRSLERRLGVQIGHRGNHFTLTGANGVAELGS